MRHSLLLRLLALSLGVALLSIAATALLATYGTGRQLQGAVEQDASLLEADRVIHDVLLGYATDNTSWDGVQAQVRALAEQTGRRIALTRLDGRRIVDSAAILGQGSTGLPTVASARLDAAAPRVAGPDLMGSTAEPAVTIDDATRTILSGTDDLGVDRFWRLTDAERQERSELAVQAADCLRAAGIATSVVQSGSGPPAVVWDEPVRDLDPPVSGLYLSRNPCFPAELEAPSIAMRDLNETAVELTGACLSSAGLSASVVRDEFGLRVVTPLGGRDVVLPAWQECRSSAVSQALRGLVAPPALLYLGSTERFDVFSTEGWWRTSATALLVLLIAAAITVGAGRRLVRPISALTGAAQQMAAGGRTARVEVTGHDEVARLGHAFNAMTDAIASSEQQRKAMVSDVAHELRAPLTNVRGYLEAAQDGVVTLDETLVGSLLDEALLLERLVTDLQELALADAGMLRLHLEERDVADLARQAVAAHRAAADAAGVAVDVVGDIDGAPVVALVDPARLRQALGNVVANAVKYTPAGGRVDVAVHTTPELIGVTVKDTGPGIEPEHLPHLFNRFYRADPSRTRSSGGSGLGLAISKYLVEAHSGRIEASSGPGPGATFTIWLPAHCVAATPV